MRAVFLPSPPLTPPRDDDCRPPLSPLPDHCAEMHELHACGSDPDVIFPMAFVAVAIAELLFLISFITGSARLGSLVETGAEPTHPEGSKIIVRRKGTLFGGGCGCLRGRPRGRFTSGSWPVSCGAHMGGWSERLRHRRQRVAGRGSLPVGVARTIARKDLLLGEHGSAHERRSSCLFASKKYPKKGIPFRDS